MWMTLGYKRWSKGVDGGVSAGRSAGVGGGKGRRRVGVESGGQRQWMVEWSSAASGRTEGDGRKGGLHFKHVAASDK